MLTNRAKLINKYIAYIKYHKFDKKTYILLINTASKLLGLPVSEIKQLLKDFYHCRYYQREMFLDRFCLPMKLYNSFGDRVEKIQRAEELYL